MTYTATLPWAGSRHPDSLDGEPIRGPGDLEIKPWQKEAVSFEVKIYVHRQPFTASLEESIETCPVFIIIARTGPKSRKWRIDCIDDESLAAYKERNMAQIRQSIFRAAAGEMWRRGLNPMEVIGWRKFANGWDYRQILEDAWSQR